MFDNYFFLKRICKELKEKLYGLTFFQAVSQSKNEIVIKLFRSELEQFLIFTFQQLPPLLYLKDVFPFAKKNYAKFFENLREKEIKNLRIDDYERNVFLEFDSEKLTFLFRGPHSNLILFDETYTILDSFKDKDDLIGKNFYEAFPSTDFDKLIFTDENKFNFSFTSDTNQSKILKKILGKDLVEEIIYRSSKNSYSYFNAFNELITEIDSSPLRIYSDFTCSFCNLTYKNLNYRIAENIFQEYPKTYFLLQKDQALQNIKNSLLKKLRDEYEKLIKKYQELNRPENFIDRSEEYRTIGNLILIHANEIKRGSKTFKTNFENRDYTIKLDLAKSPFENAQLYFEKARVESRRIESLNNLIKKIENDLEEIKEKINEVESTTKIEALKNHLKKSDTTKTQNTILKHFRHFVLDEKYHAYVGKNSQANEILTLEFAKNDDLWFHARGVTGSHVIIRRENKKESIPKNIIEKTASIAAYYSKAKHSKLVPVSYTEKKYVIKRKGMPPGTVQLIKEKVIMVEPKIPADAKQIQDE